MSNKNYIHTDLTDKIISCAYDVYNKLGYGFLEKVYENAMMIKLGEKGINASQQSPVNVRFEGNIVGEYFADILVDNKVIIELKAVSELSKIHEVQLVNYLKAAGIKVGLLINSAGKIKIIHKVFLIIFFFPALSYLISENRSTELTSKSVSKKSVSLIIFYQCQSFD